MCAACGGSLLAEHGQFTSPRYPDAYVAGVECVWNIDIAPGNRLMLNFRYRTVAAALHWLRSFSHVGPIEMLHYNALPINAVYRCVCSFFDIEWSPGCTNDFVEISRSEDFAVNRRIGRYCGSRPRLRWMLGSKVWIKFRSDANNATTDRGFVASYSSRELTFCSVSSSFEQTEHLSSYVIPNVPSSSSSGHRCLQ